MVRRHCTICLSHLHRDGRLKVGDEILTVNGKSMRGLTQQEASNILKGTSSTVQLVVCRLLVRVGREREGMLYLSILFNCRNIPCPSVTQR